MVRNITQTIYQKLEKPEILYMFGWIELIAILFHFLTNILNLFIYTFWRKSNNKYFFLHFRIVLRKKVYKNVKDFYLNNNFFHTIIHSHLIAFLHK